MELFLQREFGRGQLGGLLEVEQAGLCSLDTSQARKDHRPSTILVHQLDLASRRERHLWRQGTLVLVADVCGDRVFSCSCKKGWAPN